MKKDYTEEDFLCPTCSEKIKTKHIMQCGCCQTIVDYIDVQEGEQQSLIMLNQCPNCAGYSKEEWGFDQFFRENSIL